ncbi:MAG: hypothetical protein CVU73_09545 [Deltaproteobacteria bacterium HGW-Deltaproteobacteria-8]|jgi:hypothetical protein|nr:MAG: hypothetical protein CVU73_09545 [Deltaproteobacteria bacterium HGW-Deltaproteobacteria-8]
MKLSRCFTGPDDDANCLRVSLALNTGWELHGGPSLSFDPVRGSAILAQAMAKEAECEFSPDLDLATL